MVRRFRLIDAEFRRLAPTYPNTVVINRDGREFHDRGGLVSIIEAAGLPPFEEVPYRVMDRYEPAVADGTPRAYRPIAPSGIDAVSSVKRASVAPLGTRNENVHANAGVAPTSANDWAVL